MNSFSKLIITKAFHKKLIQAVIIEDEEEHDDIGPSTKVNISVIFFS